MCAQSTERCTWRLVVVRHLCSRTLQAAASEPCLDLGEESLPLRPCQTWPAFMAQILAAFHPVTTCVFMWNAESFQSPMRVSCLRSFFTQQIFHRLLLKVILTLWPKKNKWHSFCFLHFVCKKKTVLSCRCTREMRPHSKSQAFKSTRTIGFASVCVAGAQIPHRNLVDLSAHPLPLCFSKMRSCSREKWDA